MRNRLDSPEPEAYTESRDEKEFPRGEPMKQEKQRFGMFFLIGIGIFCATAVYGQSVTDLARQTRTRLAQERKSGRVFTNDNVLTSAPAPAAPAPAAPGGPEAKKPEGQAQGAATPAAAPGQQPSQAAAATQPPAKTEAEQEKEYREKFAKLREAQALEEKKLDVMQRELNLMQNQFYTNPQDTLMQELTRGNINQRMKDLETQKAAAEKAKLAVADLEEELRKKGLPAGWAR